MPSTDHFTKLLANLMFLTYVSLNIYFLWKIWAHFTYSQCILTCMSQILILFFIFFLHLLDPLAKCHRPHENFMRLVNEKDVYDNKEILKYNCIEPYNEIPEGQLICENGKWSGNFVCTSESLKKLSF